MLIRSMHFLIPLAAACAIGCTVHGQDESAGSRQRRTVLEELAGSLLEAVNRSVTRFEGHLNQVPQRDERDDLMLRLGWSQFRSELAKPAPDIYSMRAFSKRLYEPFELVDLQAAIELRDSIDRYTDVMRVLGCPSLESEIQRRLNTVEKLRASTERLDTVQLGEHLDWLETAGVTMDSETIRRQYNQPNIRLDIPKTFAVQQVKQFNQEVNQTQYVTNVVLGTPISGEAHTSGTARATLLADGETAGFSVNLQGVISSPNNVAVQNPVVVYTSGRTTFSASTSVVWDGELLTVGEASADCRTASRIKDITVTRQPLLRAGLINRVISRTAWRRVEQQRESGELAASRLAEERLAEALNEQVSESVDKVNSQFQEFAVQPLRRVGMLPSINATIQPAAIQVSMLRYGPGQLAAPQPPQPKASNEQFVLCFHESALAAFFLKSAGGAVWTDRKFADLQRALIGDNSYELRIGLHPRWQTRLDWARPLVTRFDDGSFVIQMNADSWTIDGTEYPFPFTVEATYALAATTPTLGFARVGDVRLAWTGKERPATGDEPMLSSFINRKVSGFLLEEIYLDGLRAPSGGGLWGKLGSFNTSDARTENGWMLLRFSAASQK